MKKQVITTDRIENILSGNDLAFVDNSGVQPQILIKDCEFGFFASNNTTKIAYNLIFEGCIFMQTFCLYGTSNKSIFFKNCSFYEDLSLGITCDELHIAYSSFSTFLSLGSCKINKVSCILRKTSSFRISRGEYGRFSIINSDTYILSLDFNNPTINDLEIINQENTTKNIIKVPYFKNLIVKKIKFLNLIIESKFEIQGEESNIENLEFQNVLFKEDLKILDGKFNILSILESSFEKNLELNGGSFSSIKINKLEKVNNIEVQSQAYIDEFKLTSTTKPFNLLLNSSNHNKIYLENLNSTKDNFICFNQIKVNHLIFNKFINFGSVYLINLKQGDKSIHNDSTIYILNSDLGKTTMMDCNLQDYRLDFNSSKISEVFLAGTKMPSHNRVNLNSGDKDQKRLALSQIKKIYENRGDSIESSKYQAEELNVHLETLKLGGEKINLLLNKHSNGHGQNWPRALAVTLIISLLFFIFYTWSLDYSFNLKLLFSLKGYEFLIDYKPFTDNSKYFFEFFNPTHKFDFISEKKTSLSFASGFWDFFSRVFIGYGIYQFIAAFRKHGKKS